MKVGSTFLAHEEALYNQGFRFVAGVDEAGRGPLAGSVVAAAVILPRGLIIEGVDDSKKLCAKKRTELAAIIKDMAIAYGIGVTDVDTIDRINILQATFYAMREAVEHCATVPDAVIVDGNHAPPVSCHCECLIRGDRQSHSIAAASILAKTYRDALMIKLHEQYPVYGFDRHKGYGTAAHRKNIMEYGLSPVHRKSFKIKE